MARRIFISLQYEDRMQAKGFFLLPWNKNVDIDFVGRHLLDPVKSEDRDYINQQINDQINGSSVTVVLLGKTTYQSTAVADEIRKSLEKDTPNGILAIRLPGANAPLPPNSPVGKALGLCGAEIMDWKPHDFADAIERAAKSVGRAKAIKSTTTTDQGCGR